jgi:hypothetical protein
MVTPTMWFFMMQKSWLNPVKIILDGHQFGYGKGDKIYGHHHLVGGYD